MKIDSVTANRAAVDFCRRVPSGAAVEVVTTATSITMKFEPAKKPKRKRRRRKSAPKPEPQIERSDDGSTESDSTREDGITTGSDTGFLQDVQ